MRKLFLLLLLLLCTNVFAAVNKPAKGIQVDWSNPLSRGLVACWIMNEGSGPAVYDLSGNNYTIRNTVIADTPIWVPGNDGHATYYDGADGFFRLSTVPLMNLTIKPSYTVVGSFNADSVAAQRSVMWVSPSGVGFGFGFRVGDVAGSFRFYHQNAGAGAPNVSTNVVTDKWYTFAGTWSNNVIELYVDGLSVGTSAAVGALDPTLERFYIGFQKGGVEFWLGKISYLYIYDRALSPSEISRLDRNPYCFFKKPFDLMLFGGVTAPPPFGGGQVIMIDEN